MDRGAFDEFLKSEFPKYVIYGIAIYIIVAHMVASLEIMNESEDALQCVENIPWVVFGCIFAAGFSFFFLGSLSIFNAEFNFDILPKPIDKTAENVQTMLQTYRISSNYGLFRRMTGVEGRDELVIYGSDDKDKWKVYDFKYKPTKSTKMPTFVAPHQPRLDWQMWFSALNKGMTPRDSYLNMLVFRLLSGSASVEKLLARNPFPDTPPNYIKISKIRYSFTNSSAIKEGDWLPEKWWEVGKNRKGKSNSIPNL
jgi:hypothetical protein